MGRMKEIAIELENFKDLQEKYFKLAERNAELERIVEGHAFKCPECCSELHWESDVDMLGYIEEEGIISFYHCCNCGIEVEVRRYDEPQQCNCNDYEIDYDEIPF